MEPGDVASEDSLSPRGCAVEVKPIVFSHTFILLKPDCLRRKLVQAVRSHLTLAGFLLTRSEYIKQPPLEVVEEHYAEHRGRDYYQPLVEYIAAGPVIVIDAIAMAPTAKAWLLGRMACQYVRTKYADPNDPPKRENIMHASDGPEAAERELKLWFPQKE